MKQDDPELNQVSPAAQHAVQRDGAIAPPLEKRRLHLYIVQILADVVLLLGGHTLAAHLYFHNASDERTFLAGQVLLPIFLTIALYNGTYSLSSLIDWKRASVRMAAAVALSAGLLAFVAFYTKSSAQFSRGAFTLAIVIVVGLLVAARYVLTRLVIRHISPTMMNELVINDGGAPLQLAHAYHLTAAEHGLVPSLSDPHGLDRLGRLIRNMDHVIVSCVPERRAEWALMLKGSGANAEVVSEFAHDIGALGVRHYTAADLTTLIVSTGPIGMRARVGKRILDIACSAVGLLVLSPLLLVVALLILLGDGGSPLFNQRRLGRGNRFFKMHKFRTMAVHRGDADGAQSASRGDDRVTRIGRFLRATSIDELPQLLNVLRGEMSMVGPRPHAIGSQAGDKLFWEVDQRYWQRHSLKPGMTGLAQVRGLRGATHAESDLLLRLQADLEYLNGWSIWRDIRILFLTLRVVIHDRAF